jgi:sRNA-binding protein
LAYLFPKAFFENLRQRVPLKQNIVADIERQGCNDLLGVDVAAAVDYYTNHIGYYICSAAAGRPRVDLEEQPVNTVTPEAIGRM